MQKDRSGGNLVKVAFTSPETKMGCKPHSTDDS